MVSRYELLEYLRIYKSVPTKILLKVFGPSIYPIIHRLLRDGYIRKYTYKRVKTPGGYVWKKVYTTPTERAMPAHIEITEKALNVLRIYGINSFYQLPGAIRSQKLIMKRPFVKFGDWL